MTVCKCSKKIDAKIFITLRKIGIFHKKKKTFYNKIILEIVRIITKTFEVAIKNLMSSINYKFDFLK